MQIIKKNSIFFVSILFTIIIGIFICKIKGYGSDIDTYSLIKTFLNIIENGTYNPSRYYGHPIPEVLLGYLSYNFGAFVTSYFCYLMFIFSLYFFYVSFANDKKLDNLYIFILLCISNPILLFDNTNISDFQLSMFFFSAGIYASKKNKKFLIPLLFGLTIASRLSFALFVILFLFHEYYFSGQKDKKQILINLFYSLMIGSIFYITVFYQSHLSLAFIKNTGGPPLNFLELAPRFFYKIYYLMGKFGFIFIIFIFVSKISKIYKIFVLSNFLYLFIMINLLVFFFIPTKTAIISIFLIFLYIIIINNFNKKMIFFLITINFISWFFSYEIININYKYQKICEPIQAISAKIDFRLTNGEFMKMLKKNENIVFCHSKQFSSEVEDKYLDGKKIK